MAEFSRSRISRQFTDSERAVDDRIDSHLTAPPIQLDITAGVGAGYKWLQEDLALRSTLSKQLAGEQVMAYAQSERRALAEQSRLQEAQDQEALNGVARARMLLESGQAQDAKQARQMVFGENRDLYINPVAGKVFGDLEATFESPEMRELRQRKMDLDGINMDNAIYAAGVTKRVGEYVGEEAAAERMVKRQQLEDVQFDNNVVYERGRSILVRKALRDAEEGEKVWKAVGDPTNRAARIQATGMLDKMGIKGVNLTGMSNIVANDPLTLAALMDETGRSHILRTPEEQAGYASALRTLSSSAPGTPEFEQAQQDVDLVTARWEELTRSQRTAIETAKAAQSVSKEFGDAWETTYKAIDGVMRDKDIKGDKKKQAVSMLGHYHSFLSNTTGRGNDPMVAEALSQVQALTKAAQEKGSKITPEQVHEFILNSELLFGVAYKESLVRSQLGKVAVQKAAKAVDAAEPTAISSKEEFDKLPSGAVFIWQGQRGTKP